MPESGDTPAQTGNLQNVAGAPETAGLEPQLHEQLSDAVMHLAEIDPALSVVEAPKQEAKKFHLHLKGHEKENEGRGKGKEASQKKHEPDEEEGTPSPFSDAVTDTLGGVFASITYVLIGGVVLVAIGGGIWALLEHRHADEPANVVKSSALRQRAANDTSEANTSSRMAEVPVTPAPGVQSPATPPEAANPQVAHPVTPGNHATQNVPRLPKPAPSRIAMAPSNPVKSPLSKPNTASAPQPLRSPDVKAQLRKLWQQGATAKKRGDYAAARRAWEAALRIAPGNRGFQESINKLPH